MASGSERRHQPPPNHHHHHHYHSSRHSSNLNGINGNGDGQHRHQNQHQRPREHERDHGERHNNAPPPPSGGTPGNGPMASHIQVAKPYVFQQAIDGCLRDVGVAQAREDSIRLAGVLWIDGVRRAMGLPVRTFDTAVIYYHKFRLVHSDGEYSLVDAAAASLFASCKIEDTLKKSRDILCAAHNLKVGSRAEHLSPDDTIFETQSRTIIGLERLMLESSSFDFRNRHPQHLMIKLAKYYRISRSSPVLKLAYSISLDMYRTFAPLKQSTATLAFSCLELAARLLGMMESSQALEDIATGRHYERWSTTRAEVMETLLDLLELYTMNRTSTVVGPDINLDKFLEVRIPLNAEMSDRKLPRFTEYIPLERLKSSTDTGSYAATVNGVSAASAAANSASKTQSPTTPSTPRAANGGVGIRQKQGERGREGTVRFMLNPDRERNESAVVAEYHLPGPKSGLGAGGAGGRGSGGGTALGASTAATAHAITVTSDARSRR